MKLTDAYGGMAILLFVAGLSAQTDRPSVATSKPAGGTAIVTVGCINRAVPTGSLAPAPGVPAATPATAEILANSSEPTNTFLLARATAAKAANEIRARAVAGEPVRTSPTTYVLDGTRQELEHHSGHLVEVTGTLRMVSEGDNANRTSVAHVQVASIKMLASACPNPAGETPK
jgi:hypothetical protein